MKGRVSMRVNGFWRIVGAEENVYEGVQQIRNWGGISKRQQRPHYCYKEGSDRERGVSASCRMCRVEREGIALKPVPACSRPVGNGRSVWTESPRVQKGREGVIERRLRYHPLDCPICDQGGECDLQEQGMAYGSDSSRRAGKKRAVEDKTRGGHVKRVMTRCIHCTRCVRYSKEVGQGTVNQGGRGIRGRGVNSEIGRYTPWSRLNLLMGGGRVERCPVGARTTELGKFRVRPWERTRGEITDFRDSVQAPRAVKYVDGERVGVRPKRGSRGERLGDKTRYGYDGRGVGRRREPRVPAKSEWVRGWAKSLSVGFETRIEEGDVLYSGENSKGSRGSMHYRNPVEMVSGLQKGRTEQLVNGIRRMRVGTGVDQERRSTRQQSELKGEREVQARGVGARAESRYTSEERGRIGGVESLKQATTRRSIGRRRDRELPVRGYRTKNTMGGTTDINRSRGVGSTPEEREATMSVGREAWQSRAAGTIIESKKRESMHVRRGGGVWTREDGRGWRKRKGLCERGYEESGERRSERESRGRVSVIHRASNSLGSRVRGRKGYGRDG